MRGVVFLTERWCGLRSSVRFLKVVYVSKEVVLFAETWYFLPRGGVFCWDLRLRACV